MFVSDRLVQTLKLATEPCQLLNFKAADVGQLQSTDRVPALHWWIQGHTFISDARVLPLRCYDMIVGEDWLEAVSPVWVDYKTKVMRVTHHDNRITLQGVKDQLDSCPEISSNKLQSLHKSGMVACCIQLSEGFQQNELPDVLQYVSAIDSVESDSLPEPLQHLLTEFEHLFATPTALPPRHEADHQINLLPGAQPISVRPYHYSPIQKTEIENQLRDMLQSGVVRSSTSAFASSVLLVRKKDATWRLCRLPTLESHYCEA